MKLHVLGKNVDGERSLRIDLDRLVESRLLVQANSGAGKSWALRRILEQTHGSIQQLVIDVEDEFHTLREKFDYILAGRHGGDCPAEPRSAPLLARRLLELGVSAIVGIYELKAHERTSFVQLFLDALVNAPRNLWHPVLVVVDEAHIFCPQKGEAESACAVIDLMTRGRKRGFCGILATQRLSKLHKDAAAEANNKLIGRSALDVDMKRAAEELGFSTREDQHRLRKLEPGHFFCFGPALSDQVGEVLVGDVETRHPRAGERAAPAPPAREKVRRVLGQLADLPREAEEEARTLADAKAKIRQLEAQLRTRPKEQVEKTVTKPVEVPTLKDAQVKRLGAAAQRIRDGIATWEKARARSDERVASVILAAGAIADEIKVALAAAGAAQARLQSPPAAAVSRPAGAVAAAIQRPAARPATGNGGARHTAASVKGLTGPEQRILDALAELEVLGVRQPERVQVAFLAGYTHLNSKGLVNAMGALRSAALIDYPAQGLVTLTAGGRDQARAPDAPRSPQDLHDRVIRLLGGASGRLLQPLIDAYPNPVPRVALAEAAGYGHLNSKGFVNAIGRLRSLGFIDYPTRGDVVARPVLFLEGQP